MKDYSLGLMQPGEEREVNAYGDYIRNIGVGSVKIVARNLDKSVKAFSTVLGAGGWRSPESEYNHWVIKNNSEVAIAVSILIGKGEAGESQVQINADVNSLTRFDNLTKGNNQYFIGSVNTALPGFFTVLALLNPTGSGVVGYIDKLRINADGDDMHLGVATEAELIAASILGTVGFVHNKIMAGADGQCDFKTGFSNPIPGNPLAIIPTDSAGTPTSLDFGNAPIEVNEGFAFVISPRSSNIRNTSYLEMHEDIA